jgi:hypothetical protein
MSFPAVVLPYNPAMDGAPHKLTEQGDAGFAPAYGLSIPVQKYGYVFLYV